MLLAVAVFKCKFVFTVLVKNVTHFDVCSAALYGLAALERGVCVQIVGQKLLPATKNPSWSLLEKKLRD